MKKFDEALMDGFKNVKNISDPVQLRKFREESSLIDVEGIYIFEFGDKKEFKFCLLPYDQEGYIISIYKDNIRITEPLLMKPL